MRMLPKLTKARTRRLEFEVAARRITEGIVSSLPNPEWAGPMYVSSFAAILELVAAHGAELSEGICWLGEPAAIHERAKHPMVSDQARSMLASVAGGGDHAADLRLWVASKGSNFVYGAVRKILAPAGLGVDIAEVAMSGAPVLISLAGLSDAEASLVGHLVIESLLATAILRPQDESDDVVTLFVDEAHRFPPRGLARVVAEARKFGLALVASTQSCAQLSGELADLMLGAGTTVAFRSTPDTAMRLSAQIGKDPSDLLALPDLRCLLTVQGVPTVVVDVLPMECVPETEVPALPSSPGPGATSQSTSGPVVDQQSSLREALETDVASSDDEQRSPARG